MSRLINVAATLEDDTHLRLHEPLELQTPRDVRVSISDEQDSGLLDQDGRTEEDRLAFERFQSMSPKEKAAEFSSWVKSHSGGAGLSDYAVSRDSIYD